MSTPTYFITAASGKIGRRLVPLLLADTNKPHLVLPTGNASRLQSQLPADHDPSRITIIEGNIQDPQFVQSSLITHNVTSVFLCLTGDNELFITMNFLDAMKHAPTVKHLVYLSAAADFSLDAIKSGVLKHARFGHGAVKFIVEATLQYGTAPRAEAGGLSYTIIGPALFFDNDLRSKESIMKERFFDEPIGSVGVSRVDPADIALAAAKAFEDDGSKYHGKKIMIGSKQTYTREDTARIWSEALGFEVYAAKSDKEGLDTFEELFRKKANPVWARDMRLMYEMFEAVGFSLTEEQYREQVKFLGKEPASYERFVEETAAKWKSE